MYSVASDIHLGCWSGTKSEGIHSATLLWSQAERYTRVLMVMFVMCMLLNSSVIQCQQSCTLVLYVFMHLLRESHTTSYHWVLLTYSTFWPESALIQTTDKLNTYMGFIHSTTHTWQESTVADMVLNRLVWYLSYCWCFCGEQTFAVYWLVFR